MKTRVLYFLTVAMFVLSSCEKDKSQTKRAPKQLQMTEKSAAVIQQSNTFGIELFKKISQAESGNLM